MTKRAATPSNCDHKRKPPLMKGSTRLNLVYITAPKKFFHFLMLHNQLKACYCHTEPFTEKKILIIQSMYTDVILALVLMY